MSKKLLLAVIIVLLITNIASVLIFSRGEMVTLDEDNQKLSARDTVATVDGETITSEAWINSLTNTYGKDQLKTMIDREVVEKLAEENKIEVDEKVISREISLLATMQGITSKEEYALLKDGWRRDIIYRYQLEQLLTMDTQIPEEEIKNFYDLHGNQYNFTAAMQLSHILVPDMQTAEKVIGELKQGASFPLLAEEYTMDEESENNGGYIGFLHTNSQFFPNGYEEVAHDMEEGTYSEPFRADTGIAIIYLHRKLPSITFTYDELKPYIKSELAMQKTDESLSASRLWGELEIDWIFEE
ncbi:protein secretion protein [Oceanobacillus piezotolerans]|uniref:peptidylprolyl isomerase n=1 Tax=Oceanobacillus piezotolerans TaxID=2448030 RepID=A0A498D5C2_9BACI|nr:peptidylprolyl isomerase [Oceanobacillus piezotolerans]RLL41665.1 protein secretion protein [Oceanobacillus piezotolerans]